MPKKKALPPLCMLRFGYRVLGPNESLCQFDGDKEIKSFSRCNRPAAGAMLIEPDDISKKPMSVKLCKQHLARVISDLAELLAD